MPTTILVTLIVYKLVLLGIGLFAQRRTKNKEDLYLGGRKLGPLVAAISAAASSSSVWTLLGVSGMAFASGISAIWLFPACVGGFALNWYLLAPRLRRHSAAQNALTLTDVLAGPVDQSGRRGVVVIASIITLFCLMTYVATQLNGAGKSFHNAFANTDLEMSPTVAILVGSAIVVIYTMLGGFWAVSLTDTLQGLMMAAVALALPIAALVDVGGFGGLFTKLEAIEDAQYLSLLGDYAPIAGIGFLIGLTGITFGYPGQPHVVNRFMALADDQDVRIARRYAMTWAVLVYAGMIIVGLCARAELGGIEDTEQAFFQLGKRLFPDILYGIMLAAVLSAIMSTADSQLLVSASTVSYDLGYAHAVESKQLARDRWIILALTAGAVLAAIYGDNRIFDKVLFAWTGAGAAFGPLVLWILWRGPVSSRVAGTTMLVGFGTCVVAYTGNKVFGWWNLHGFEHRFLPYAAATITLLVLARRPR